MHHFICLSARCPHNFFCNGLTQAVNFKEIELRKATTSSVVEHESPAAHQTSQLAFAKTNCGTLESNLRAATEIAAAVTADVKEENAAELATVENKNVQLTEPLVAVKTAAITTTKTRASQTAQAVAVNVRCGGLEAAVETTSKALAQTAQAKAAEARCEQFQTEMEAVGPLNSLHEKETVASQQVCEAAEKELEAARKDFVQAEIIVAARNKQANDNEAAPRKELCSINIATDGEVDTSLAAAAVVADDLTFVKREHEAQKLSLRTPDNAAAKELETKVSQYIAEIKSLTSKYEEMCF